MRTLSGSITFPFSAMVQDTIQNFGLSWAVDYYRSKHKLSAREFRIFAGI